MKKKARPKAEIKIFSSIEEENAQEYERRKNMTPEQRLREFAVVQARRWGKDWTSKPIVKKVSYEKKFS